MGNSLASILSQKLAWTFQHSPWLWASGLAHFSEMPPVPPSCWGRAAISPDKFTLWKCTSAHLFPVKKAVWKQLSSTQHLAKLISDISGGILGSWGPTSAMGAQEVPLQPLRVQQLLSSPLSVWNIVNCSYISLLFTWIHPCSHLSPLLCCSVLRDRWGQWIPVISSVSSHVFDK